jgi:hypothetical protein
MWDGRNAFMILVGEPLGKQPLGRPNEDTEVEP